MFLKSKGFLRNAGHWKKHGFETFSGFEKFERRDNIPLATGTHFIKSGLPVCPVFPFRAVYSSKTCTLRRFTQFMQFMQTEQFMQFMRFVLVYQKTGPDRSRPVLKQTA